jgi:thioredoxin-like negative regulator of GroEL
METLTEEVELDSAISKERVLVFFSSDSCETCKKLLEILENIEVEIQIYKFILDKREVFCLRKKPDFAQAKSYRMIEKFEVLSVPTLILFENGIEIKRFVGLGTKEDIQKFLSLIQ